MTPTRFSYTPWWSPNPDLANRPTPVSLEGYRDDDLIAYMVRTHRTFWELDLLEYVAMVGPRGGIYLDVGGNIGNHAVFFGLFCADHVATFEPHPDLIPILQRNLTNNKLSSKSTLFSFACGAADATGSMSIRKGYEQNIGASHVALHSPVADRAAPARTLPLPPGEGRGEGVPKQPVAQSGTGTTSHTIPIRPLDSMVDELLRKVRLPITFLKIDVEGMEMEVLAGATRTLRDHRPQLLVELITPESHAAGTALLSQFNYKEITHLSDPPSYYFIDPARHTLRPNLWTSGSYYAHQLHLAESAVRKLTPDSATLIVADSDELALGPTFAGRKRLPFTESNGLYFGPPTDDAHALSELDRLHAAGATHFLLAPPAFWYRDTYKAFMTHLHQSHHCLQDDSHLSLFALRP